MRSCPRYQRQGLDVDPERIVLTASTSDAYSLLFRLLADAGDEILIPRPSYPLFDHLTRLDLVGARPYDLEYHGAWRIDFASLERAFTPRTRAVLVVSPNNPTGSFIDRAEFERLQTICAARNVAIIGDEVFADYELEPDATQRAGRIATARSALTFALGGLSKSVGLPQVKLGWIAVAGPPVLVEAAMPRLELICDTYLSVSTPVQSAAAALLDRGAEIRTRIHDRVRANYAALRETVDRVPSCRVLRSDAGWYAVLQVPTFESEEDLALRLLTRDGVVVHPGYFFDFPRESFLVVSLLAAARSVRRRHRPDTAALRTQRLDRQMGNRRAGLLVPLFSCPSSASWGIGEIRRCRAAWRPGWRAQAQRVRSCFPSTRWHQASNRPTRRSARWRSIRSSSALPGVPEFEALGGNREPFSWRSRQLLDTVRQSPRFVDYRRVRALKAPWLRASFDRFVETEWRCGSLRARELEDVHQRAGVVDRGLRAVPRNSRARRRAALDRMAGEPAAARAGGDRSGPSPARRDEVLFYQYLQWLAHAQWHAVRERTPRRRTVSATCRSWSTPTARMSGRGSISSISMCRSARRPTRSARPDRIGACRCTTGT